MSKISIVKKIFRIIIQGIGLVTILVLLFIITSSLIYLISFRIEVKSYSKHIKAIFEQSDLIGKDIQVALNHLPWPNEIETRRELEIEENTGIIVERGNYYGALIYYTDKEFYKRAGIFIGRGCEILFDQNNKITEIK